MMSASLEGFTRGKILAFLYTLLITQLLVLQMSPTLSMLFRNLNVIQNMWSVIFRLCGYVVD